MIANRLTSPTPLLRVEDWAREWAVEEVCGAAPDSLDDDRVGRALDAVAPQLDAIVGSVGARAISEFGIDVARLHWDMLRASGSCDAVRASEPGARRRLGRAWR